MKPLEDIDLLAYRVLKSCAVVMGLMHPERASNYEVGWTSNLPKIDDEPFDGAPFKRSKKRSGVPSLAEAMLRESERTP